MWIFAIWVFLSKNVQLRSFLALVTKVKKRKQTRFPARSYNAHRVQWQSLTGLQEKYACVNHEEQHELQNTLKNRSAHISQARTGSLNGLVKAWRAHNEQCAVSVRAAVSGCRSAASGKALLTGRHLRWTLLL